MEKLTNTNRKKTNRTIVLWLLSATLLIAPSCSTFEGFLDGRSGPAPKDSVIYNYIEKDTTIYNITYEDSIAYNIIEKDSIDYTIIERDSIDYNIIERDSIDYTIIEKDSIAYNIIERDSIKYTIVEQPHPPTLELTQRITNGREMLHMTFRSQQADSVRLTMQCVPGMEAKDFEIYRYAITGGTAHARSLKQCPAVAVVTAETPHGVWVESLNMQIMRTINSR